MTARSFGVGLALLLEASSLSAQTTAELEGELSFWVGDADLSSHAENETAFFGAEPSTPLAIDELSLRDNARARRLALGFSARTPALFFPGSTAIRTRFGVEHEPESGRLRVRDQGSYLEIGQGSEIITKSLRLFPLDGDGLRAGWSEALAWGGEAGNLGESPYARAQGLVPALVFEHRSPGLVLWAGAKAARLDVPTKEGFERESLEPGVLGGVEYGAAAWLELGVHAGALRHGAMTQPDVRGEALVTAGASARALLLLKLDAPALSGTFPSPVAALPDGELGFALSLEASWLEQRLKQAEFHGAVRWTPARGAAMLAAVAFGRVELVTGVLARDAAFVTRQGPGALLPETPPQTRPREIEWTFVSEGRFGLTSFLTGALELGFRRPAFQILPSASGEASIALLVRGPGRVELLTPGAQPLPVLEGRAVLSAELSTATSAALFFEYVRDANRTDFERRPGDVRWVPTLASPHSLGYGVAVKSDL